MIEQPPLLNGRDGGAEIDALLRRFFRAELPEPWPCLQLPAMPKPRPRPTVWQRSRTQLAVAAGVMLLMGGYLTVERLFPAVVSGNVQLPGLHISHREPGKHHFIPNNVEHVKTPQGRDARMLQETTDEARPTIIFNIQADPNPRR